MVNRYRVAISVGSNAIRIHEIQLIKEHVPADADVVRQAPRALRGHCLFGLSAGSVEDTGNRHVPAVLEVDAEGTVLFYRLLRRFSMTLSFYCRYTTLSIFLSDCNRKQHYD